MSRAYFSEFSRGFHTGLLSLIGSIVLFFCVKGTGVPVIVLE